MGDLSGFSKNENEAAAIALQNMEFAKSIDKILIAHRNTKFFLFCMSWQFFLVYFIVKKIMQGLVLYYIYKKRKEAEK